MLNVRVYVPPVGAAPAMKKQWVEAMSGANTPETPQRSRRGSTSLDGSAGRGELLFSPSGTIHCGKVR